jgi:hypothetical protein
MNPLKFLMILSHAIWESRRHKATVRLSPFSWRSTRHDTISPGTSRCCMINSDSYVIKGKRYCVQSILTNSRIPRTCRYLGFIHVHGQTCHVKVCWIHILILVLPWTCHLSECNLRWQRMSQTEEVHRMTVHKRARHSVLYSKDNNNKKCM